MENKKNEKHYDCLEVSSVQVHPFKMGSGMGNVLAIAMIVLNDQLIVRGLRVMDGETGLYVGYAQDPFFYDGGDFKAVCNPITRQLRDHIEQRVLEKYHEAVKEG